MWRRDREVPEEEDEEECSVADEVVEEDEGEKKNQRMARKETTAKATREGIERVCCVWSAASIFSGGRGLRLF